MPILAFSPQFHSKQWPKTVHLSWVHFLLHSESSISLQDWAKSLLKCTHCQNKQKRWLQLGLKAYIYIYICIYICAQELVGCPPFRPQRLDRMSTWYCVFESANLTKPLFYSIFGINQPIGEIGELIGCPPRELIRCAPEVSKARPRKVDTPLTLRWPSLENPYTIPEIRVFSNVLSSPCLCQIPNSALLHHLGTNYVQWSGGRWTSY